MHDTALQPGLAGLLMIALLMSLRTPREERMMLEAFGPRYADYMARTGRYVPRVWRRRPMAESAEPS
jgi:protein-S-isoprenylcysteine O-methyltransferase Ste14